MVTVKVFEIEIGTGTQITFILRTFVELPNIFEAIHEYEPLSSIPADLISYVKSVDVPLN